MTNTDNNAGVSPINGASVKGSQRSKLHVLAVGAGGKNAGLVIPELAKRAVHVRGLIQDKKQEQAVLRAGAAEVMVGDLTDRASVDAALKGMDAVFYIAPVGLKNEAEVGRNMIDAAKRAGVRRVVFSSIIDPILSALETHAAKAPVEEAILASGLEYTLLQPGMFFQGIADGWDDAAAKGTYGEPWAMKGRFSRVDYRDVAEVAAIALTEDRLLHGTFQLCAAGDVDRRDIAALMSDVLGKTVKAVDLDSSKMAQAAGPEAGAQISRMFDYYGRHGVLGSALALRAILGREPRTLRDYLLELSTRTHAVA